MCTTSVGTGRDNHGNAGAGTGLGDRPGGSGGDELLDVAADALRRVAAVPVSELGSDEVLTGSVQRLHRLEAMVVAEKLRRVAEIDARKAYRGAAVTTHGLLADRLGLTRAEAKAVTATALGLRRLPQTAARLASGELAFAQAHTAVRALEDLSAAAGAAADARAVDDGDGADGDDSGAATDTAVALDQAVVEAVCGGHGRRPWDRQRLGRHLDAWAHTRGHDQLVRRERRAWDKRRLWAGPSGDADGSVSVEGRLDALGGAHLLAALEALARSQGPEDVRTFAQRRADALVSLARCFLDGGGPDQAAAPRPHVLLVTSPEALHDIPGAAPAQLDGVGAVSAATARQVCCDAELTPVTTRNGEALDVGRTHRTPSRAQRAAVIARDGACTGCRAAAGRCQIHHIVWHRHGGPTDLDNLVLVCWDCHYHIHHHGWQVTRGPNGRYATAPPPGG